MQEEHKLKAPQSVICAIVTVSNSRDTVSDKSGSLIKKILEKNSHIVIDYSIVKDNEKLIYEKINEIQKNSDIDVIITNGGTGVGATDVTIDAIKPLFDKELTGFSNLFSTLSYEDIGSAAFLSRATAGIASKTIIFCLPGSPKAVELAMNKLILSEIGHIVKHLGD